MLSFFSKHISFSKQFDVSEDDIERLGFFDTTLNIDSKLYIDSKLLTDDISPFFIGARSLLKKKFEDIIKLLSHAKTNSLDNMFWHQAYKKLTFKEIKGTCLGYSGQGIDGKAIGHKMRMSILTRCWNLISEGRNDPELFELICIFEENFGCDRASDLVTFLIKDVIYAYNESIIKELNLERFETITVDGHTLLKNPYKKETPILLVPKCILSSLPICFSFSDIEYAVSENQLARENLSRLLSIGEPFSKENVYKTLLNDRVIYDAIIKKYKKVNGNAYDFNSDSKCLFLIRDFLNSLSQKDSLIFKPNTPFDCCNIFDVTERCIGVFKHLVEDCGIRKDICNSNEKLSQHFFLSASYLFCEENRVCLAPESNNGNGPVDFLLTNGLEKVSIEIKKISNPKYKDGLTKQLPAYMKSNNSVFGYFVLINDESKTTKKVETIYEAYNNMDIDFKNKIKIIVIDSFLIPSASKLT